jgi:hypothetical protein
LHDEDEDEMLCQKIKEMITDWREHSEPQ